MARYRRSPPVHNRKGKLLNYYKHRKVNSKLLGLTKSQWGRYMFTLKGARHAHITQRYTGHFAFMNICQQYMRKLKRKLTPAELSHIRVTHKEEIAAASVGKPYPNPKPKWNLVTEE